MASRSTTVAGIANLFELLYVHNGYFTAERHSLEPHQAQPLQLLGSLSVHPLWRQPRDWLLAHWERSGADRNGDGHDSVLVIRAATTESTYFPLVDSQGQPIQHTYELGLTPGGLTGR